MNQGDWEVFTDFMEFVRAAAPEAAVLGMPQPPTDEDVQAEAFKFVCAYIGRFPDYMEWKKGRGEPPDAPPRGHRQPSARGPKPSKGIWEPPPGSLRSMRLIVDRFDLRDFIEAVEFLRTAMSGADGRQQAWTDRECQVHLFGHACAYIRERQPYKKWRKERRLANSSDSPL